MKTALSTIGLLMLASPIMADKIEDAMAGVADLKSLMGSTSFLLSKTYSGELSLKLGKEDINHDKTLSRIYNCFTYDASKFSETDQPKPKLSAIYHGTSLKGSGTGYGDFAFIDYDIHSVVDDLKDVKKLEEFKRLVPKAIPIGREQSSKNDPETYWYSWAEVLDDGRLIVRYLEAEQDGHEFALWLWEGECQKRNIAPEQAGAAQVTTKPADTPTVKDKPSTTESKDTLR